MFDFVKYLSKVTGDDTWQPMDASHFVNSRQNKAHFVVNDGLVMFSMDGKLIYVGPLDDDYPDYVQ